MMIIKSIALIMTPAIPSPRPVPPLLPDIARPTMEKTIPRTQKIHPINGIQPRKMLIIANTNPVVAGPFDWWVTG